MSVSNILYCDASFVRRDVAVCTITIIEEMKVGFK